MDAPDRARAALPGGRPGVVAIVRLRTCEPVDELLEALVAGGVRAVEVTLPTTGSLAAVRRWSQDDRVTAGVGTVRAPGHVALAAQAGAAFLVTPTTRVEVLDAAAERGLPVVSGALTPTEIDLAWGAGAAAVKVFPVSTVGGAAYLRAVREPLDDAALLAAGGVDVAATAEYARSGCVGVGVGSALVSEQLVADRDWAGLTERARRFVAGWQAGLDGRG